MKRTTKKLSGVGLELFLRRYYASYSGIDDALARKLSADGLKTFASVRVRRLAWSDWRRRSEQSAGTAGGLTGTARTASKPAETAKGREAAATFAKPVAGAVPPPKPETNASPAEEAHTAQAFDPYAIGLVPTFQREGADGLLVKLAEIDSIDNLRKTARAQQVALPAELRGPEAQIDAIRNAIVEAVGKRIANRRAAAG